MAADPQIRQRFDNSEILLIGGSAGSFKLIFKILGNLPQPLNKTVIIVMHRKRNYVSEVEQLFARICSIPLKEVSDKDRINKNMVYIAPANYHLLIEKNGLFSLDVSEDVWYSKPSIDVTFESAADIYNDRCTAILFSGANADGAAGLLKLRNNGSLTIVQDPAEAEMPEMPQTALNLNAAAYVLSTLEIFELLKK